MYQVKGVVLPSKQRVSINTSEQVTKYFNIYQLSSLLDELPFHISQSYVQKVQNIKEKILENKQVGAPFIAELSSILTFSWRDIIDEMDEGSLEISEQTKSFWHYLIGKFAPFWKYTGQLPKHILPELLDIIDFFFQHKDDEHFWKMLSKNLANFINTLAACPIEDVNYLYSCSLNCNGKTIYLLEVFIECFQQTEDLADKLVLIANMIYDIDPSLIGKSKQLKSLYEFHQAAEYFGIKKLRDLLRKLEIKSNESAAVFLEQVKEVAEKATRIDTDLIALLSKLYKQAYLSFIDSEEDYLRSTGVLNKAWINLAQHLAAAKLIHPNYYKFLMPSLTHDLDFITSEYLTLFPLNYYILSDNGKELIFLQNCVNYHKNNGAFYNCNHVSPQALSKKERQRLTHAYLKFVDYFNCVEARAVDVPLKKKTIDKVKKLTEESLYVEGLSLGSDYNGSQLAAADKAYENFLKFIVKLPEEERQNLYNQHILFHGKLVSFMEIMEHVQTKGDCIAVWGQFLVKLVVDYDPFSKFLADLEIKLDIDAMRRCSVKKVYRDYSDISQKEARERLIIIFTSLMAHPFKFVFFTGTTIHAWDLNNSVTLTGKEIYQLIAPCILTGNFEEAQFIYASLIETIVKPALAEEGLVTTMTRYNDTRCWLQAIEDHTIFDLAKTNFFEPWIIFSVLWIQNNKNNRLHPLIEPFLEQLVLILAQNKNDYINWIMINVKFSILLKTCNEPFAIKVLQELRNAAKTLHSEYFIKNISEFVIHRLACMITGEPPKHYVFFKEALSSNRVNYFSFTRQMKQALEPLYLSQDTPVADLLSIILRTATQLVGNFNAGWIDDYRTTEVNLSSDSEKPAALKF